MANSQRRWNLDWTRRIFYLQAFSAMCWIIGFNVSATLATAGWLMAVLALVLGTCLLLSTVLPLVILIVAIRENHSWFRVTAITGLSVVLTIASLYALLPCVM